MIACINSRVVRSNTIEAVSGIRYLSTSIGPQSLAVANVTSHTVLYCWDLIYSLVIIFQSSDLIWLDRKINLDMKTRRRVFVIKNIHSKSQTGSDCNAWIKRLKNLVYKPTIKLCEQRNVGERFCCRQGIISQPITRHLLKGLLNNPQIVPLWKLKSELCNLWDCCLYDVVINRAASDSDRCYVTLVYPSRDWGYSLTRPTKSVLSGSK